MIQIISNDLQSNRLQDESTALTYEMSSGETKVIVYSFHCYFGYPGKICIFNYFYKSINLTLINCILGKLNCI